VRWTEDWEVKDRLAPDETIETILPHLTDPDGYVRRVFGNMHRHEKIRDRLGVRIGVQGTGQKPYFRIVLDAVAGQEDRDDQIMGAYYDNGDPLRTSASTNSNWSTATTSYADVRAILEKWMNQRKQERSTIR
jgi:hypothetical protein